MKPLSTRLHLFPMSLIAMLLAWLGGILFFQPLYAADTIVQWTFDSQPADANTATGSISPTLGNGSASLVGGTTANFFAGFPANPSGGDNSGWSTASYPAQDSNPKSAGTQFTVSTVGYQGITLDFRQRHSDSAANTVQVQYALDGATFVDFVNFSLTPLASGTSDTWFTRTVDFSAITALDNNPLAAFRIVSAFDPFVGQYVASKAATTYTSAGTWRFDNVTIAGTADTAPVISSNEPVSNASAVPLNANLVITFSEPVTVTDNTWFALTCTNSSSHTANVSGGPTAFTLNPDIDFTNHETCTLTIPGSQVLDLDPIDPPDSMVAPYSFSFTTVDLCAQPFTPTYQIQGTGTKVAGLLENVVVTTQGVVVGDYEGASPALRGFYLQDVTGDGNPATSDALWVFDNGNNLVNLGQVVRVTGTAGEFQDQTQLGGSISVTPCGTTASVAPIDVTLPFSPAVSSVHALERYEGMLVRLPQVLYVTEHFQLGRFGQVTVSANERLIQPTNVISPGGTGSPRHLLQQANDRNQIVIDDELNHQNPDPIRFGRAGNGLSAANTLRGGDTISNVVGVLGYTWGGAAAAPNAWRVRPFNVLGSAAPLFQPSNPRPAAPEPITGSLKVMAFNTLNYFNTFGNGTCTFGVGGPPADCRGAENNTEFGRQFTKTVAAILGSQAAVIGLMEMENDGYGPTSAMQSLVDKLNAASAPGTFAFIDVDGATGQVNALGSDAIRVGLIYQPALVMPLGRTAVLNSGAFGLFQTGAITAPLAIQRNRPALAQAFQQQATGGRFVVVVNHLKSKGSPCSDNISPVGPDPDKRDGQDNCNLTRTAAASELVNWLNSDPTGTGETDIIIVGDLNANAKEDPVTAIRNGGYTNLIETLIGPHAYSYAFDGQWGYLDHALSSASLTPQVGGITEWHINADEPNSLDYNTNFKNVGQVNSLYAPDPYRSSDHDPVIVGFNLISLAPTISATVASPAYIAPPSLSAVISDPTDPGATLGISLVISDPESAANLLTVTASSDNPAVLPNTGLVLSGTGDVRTLRILPTGTGYVTITVQVTDGSGASSATQLRYAASAAFAQPAASVCHTGASAAATAVAIDADFMLLADDADQVIRLYNRQHSGLPLASFDFSSVLGLGAEPTEGGGQIVYPVDIEAATRVGNRIYWLGSHSNGVDGTALPNRYRLFATDLNGSGAGTTLTYVGRYDNLRSDLLAWDQANGNPLGLAESAKAGQSPEAVTGFAIEGLAIAPSSAVSTPTAYLGFRAPLTPGSQRTKGLIVPITNLASLPTGNPTSGVSATFGAAIELDLGGRGVRSLECNEAGCVVIAGVLDSADNFRLFTWSGAPAVAPLERNVNLSRAAMRGDVEGIVALPVSLADGSQLQLIADSGDTIWYGDGILGKDLVDDTLQKTCSVQVTLGGVMSQRVYLPLVTR